MPRLYLFALGVTLLSGAIVSAQSTLDFPVGREQAYSIDSGFHANPDANAKSVFEHTVRVEGASWLRLYFGGVELPQDSFIRISSLLEGEVQELDARTLAMWNHSTAYFNGDVVKVELIAGPGTNNNRLTINHIARERLTRQATGGSGQCGICGADDRTPSDEDWSGRLLPAGCTSSVWSEDGCLVSAGHCVSGGDVIQFNVPASNSNCSINNPPVADQFPITLSSFTNGGVGNDWAVMRTGTNSLGQTIFERYGVLRPIAAAPATVGQAVAMWGFGVDTTCIRSQIQQTSGGSIGFVASTYYEYNVDVRGGNSGSGLIRNNEIVAVVTHCTVGCPNLGTRVDLPAFVAAREALCGSGGPPSDCCFAHGTPGCDDPTCESTVCACDPFCCNTEWDSFCAGDGFEPGCGAAILCAALCSGGCQNNADCDDGNACTVDTCTGGACSNSNAAAGTACGSSTNTDCDNPDTCNGSGVCQPNNEPNGFACTTDGNACTNDVCSAGVCTHPNALAGTACGSSANTDCDNPDTCNGSGACQPNNEANGFACTTDGNACSNDICSAGVCTHPNAPAGTVCGISADTDCDNPDTCNGSGACQPNNEANGFACTTDGNACSNDICSAGVCTHPNAPAGMACGSSANTDCDNPDTCNGSGTCQPNIEPNGTACSDANFCTSPDTCQGGSCTAGPPLNCDDGNGCTQDGCNAATGCTYQDVTCGDGDPCTSDYCNPEVGCFVEQIDCDDADACTEDSCDLATGCVNEAIDCGTSNACIQASCDPRQGCLYVVIDCFDGDACNGFEECDSVLGCLPAEPLNCDDADLCTTDSCDAKMGCIHVAVKCAPGASCDPATGCCLSSCPADLNGNGEVGAEDLAFLLGAWGLNPVSSADLNCDGQVGADDLATLLGDWGPCS